MKVKKGKKIAKVKSKGKKIVAKKATIVAKKATVEKVVKFPETDNRHNYLEWKKDSHKRLVFDIMRETNLTGDAIGKEAKKRADKLGSNWKNTSLTEVIRLCNVKYISYINRYYPDVRNSKTKNPDVVVARKTISFKQYVDSKKKEIEKKA